MKQYAIRLIVALLTFATGLALATLLQASRSETACKTSYKQRLVQVKGELRSHSPANSQAERDILQVENQYLQAHVNRDVAALDAILADDFTFRGYRGVESKAERLKLVKMFGSAFKSFTIDNVQVEVYGDSATVTGEAVITNRDEDEFTERPYSYTRLYEKRQGRWQIISVRIER